MKAGEEAETLFTDGDWELKSGPIVWFVDHKWYSLHHKCKMLDDNGEPFRQTWYDPDNRYELPWCEKCPSEPPRNLLGLFTAMSRL